MSWEENTLSHLCFKVTDGTHDSPKSIISGFPYIKGTHVKDGLIDFDNCEYLSEEDHLKVISRSKPEKGDTLFANIGANLGECAYVNIDFEFSIKNVALFKPDFRYLNGRFLYFLLSSDFIQNDIIGRKSGSAQPFLSLKVLRGYKISYPPLQTQKRIADILSAYDDLIEKNLKRIKLLEQAAQNIYKEWFVNLRFPGHENSPINKGTGLPIEWKEKGLCEFTSFKQYKTKIKAYEGEKEYLATANVDGIHISERGEYFSFDKKPSRAQIAPPLNSVWFARMSNTDKVLCITENSNNDFMISSGFAGFKAEEKEFLPFLFCTINNDIFSQSKDNYATGSTQVSINNKSINSIKFIEPEIKIMKKFGKKLYPSIELINKLFKTNQKLKAARDILLPRLMNRTIEV